MDEEQMDDILKDAPGYKKLPTLSMDDIHTPTPNHYTGGLAISFTDRRIRELEKEQKKSKKN